MNITPCPHCGRMPKISDCIRINSDRRRMCSCPNLCSVISSKSYGNTFAFIYYGDGDDNTIYKIWNQAIEDYQYNETNKGNYRTWMENFRNSIYNIKGVDIG